MGGHIEFLEIGSLEGFHKIAPVVWEDLRRDEDDARDGKGFEREGHILGGQVLIFSILRGVGFMGIRA
jgi:hypothetical protein